MLRTLLLEADLVYLRNNFEGIEREDNNIDFSLSADYQVNRFVYGFFGYGFSRRDSSEDFSDFTVNEVSIGLRLQY